MTQPDLPGRPAAPPVAAPVAAAADRSGVHGDVGTGPAGGTPAGGPTAASDRRAGRSAVIGAIFLMATSAIGPGFITQTATFTAQLGAAFAAAIVISVIVDVAVQMNVWRVIGVSGQRAHELGNHVLPWLGYALAALVVAGGLVFNIGNIAGTGLGANAMLGLDPKIGGAVSAAIAICIFLSKRAGMALDRIVLFLGLVMMSATVGIAVTSGPPVGEALRNTVLPESFDFVVVTTIIGGTVGGYITYAGAHRLLDSGRTGVDHVREITRSSVIGVVLTGVMRALLFLAVLGVVAGGTALASDDPAGSAFRAAAGDVGLRVFGVILWAAAITSVIGAAYTSVSFMTSSRTPERTRSLMTVGFIVLTGGVFLLLEQAPVTLLIFAGTFNGLILPLGFGMLLWVAWRRRDLLGGYRYPTWLLVIGGLTWLLTVYLGYNALLQLGNL
ncbi:NRAMP family divalent metal transporter [Nocardioides mesophilus]|uniref:Divalent metal cation transporter n=1 Tax=Nocardioides mesophilus TaxID=433659 RepID=A0A7G9R8R5_9ACTN|nr:NRAMP family divalent metal transporter [Nocardioides mesophilus]QNN51990.1 divalent metal cation transporter [Nocardioides mesophilus]